VQTALFKAPVRTAL